MATTTQEVSKSGIFKRMQNDVREANPSVDPYKVGGVFNSFLAAFAGQFYSLYGASAHTIDEVFRQLGQSSGLTQRSSTPAKGKVVFTGFLNETIQAGTQVKVSSNIYTAITAGSITAVSYTVASLKKIDATTALATINEAHNLASSTPVTIKGADQSEYNKQNVAINIVDEYSFTYEIETTAPTTTAGTIKADTSVGVVEVESEVAGLSGNRGGDATATLTIANPRITTLRVGAGGLSGGEDAESDTEFALRTQEYFRNPPAAFSAQNIRTVALDAGAKEIGLVANGAGDVKVYVQGKTTNIPNAQLLKEVSDAVENITPVNLSFGTASTDHVQVIATVEEPTPVTISGVTPDTTAMRTSITGVVVDFFNNNLIPNATLFSSELESSIRETTDTGGNRIQTFTLDSPSANIAPSAEGNLLTLLNGEVSYV